ncbi:FkbM family methyltransferase [Acidiphilium acidophilum]|uniref:FkbM family methyltransferase n=1 Tax=Acidiphilium acidophilum TaxID=76588 RepID=UPI002E8E6C9D|nr:FkbM family methyltransferase [Acidiphilium acidophilum]
MFAGVEKNRQFVSYAQNFEDVILWRALSHVSPGYYVDIGAQDPVTDSVSMAFYEHGWRGVHVEPNGNYAERLRAARPDERVIEAAVGTTAGTIPFFDIADTGLSTGDSILAEEHRKQGFRVNRVEVPCIRLSDILDELGLADIQWLKIDVEGMERDVIASWRNSAIRPWIVLVESTEPNTAIPNFALWENSLKELGYDFVYFDGLNRFYLSIQHLELKEKFGPGPNVFDDFTLSGLASAPFCRGLIHQTEISRHEAELRAEQAEIRQHEAELRAEQAEIRQHEAELRAEQAEIRHHAVELRAEQAELRQHKAELQAAQAEIRQHEAELRAEQAEIRQHEAELRAEQVEIRRHEAELRAEQVEIRRHEAERRAEQAASEIAKLSTQISALLSSSSWKLTRPLRLARYLQQGRFGIVLIGAGMVPERVKRLKNIAGTGTLAKRISRTSLFITHRALLRVPAIGLFPSVMERHAPWLRDGFLSSDMPRTDHDISPIAVGAKPPNPLPLDLRARQVLTDLENAITGSRR